MQDLNQGLWTRISSRLNARWQTDWAIEDQAINLNSTALPYNQRAFSPLDPTAIWLSHLALAIYMIDVVNFNALAQASDFQIERRQDVFLCWMQCYCSLALSHRYDLLGIAPWFELLMTYSLDQACITSMRTHEHSHLAAMPVKCQQF